MKITNLSLALLLGSVLMILSLSGCSNGNSSTPIPNSQVDFLVFTELEIENRTADTTAPREINGVDFTFRESEADIVSPLPVPGFTSGF